VGKMSKNKNTVNAILIITVVVGSLFIAVNLYSQNNTYDEEYWNEDKTTKLTVTYEKGDALAIYNSAGTSKISKIKLELYMTPTYTGTVSSYSVSGGNMRMQIKTMTGAVKYDSGSIALSLQKPSLSSGNSVVIASATLTSAQIQSLYNVVGTYSLVYSMTSPVKLTINFADGASSSQSATASTLTYTYKIPTTTLSTISGSEVTFD
jgi:hypothetical protein